MVISFKHKTAVLNFIIFYLTKPIHLKKTSFSNKTRKLIKIIRIKQKLMLTLLKIRLLLKEKTSSKKLSP